MSARGTRLSSYAQGLILIMVSVLFFVWVVFGTVTVNKQNTAIIGSIKHEINVHGQASADRNCASTELLAFIIKTGNKRAHELKTGSYLGPKEKERIRQYVREACKFTEV